MANTVLSMSRDKFIINNELTYSEYGPVAESSFGLLFNQRLIQGVFDDAGHHERYYRKGVPCFTPESNTANLISSLQSWYSSGLRAITVGFQGGWPHSVIPADQINNNPFIDDGREIDKAYQVRMDSIIKAADQLGMVVIVNFLYWAQAMKLGSGKSILNAVRSGSRFLRNGGYSNVIIDIANEYNIDKWEPLPCVRNLQSMAMLIEIAKEESGGLLVGSSGGGGLADDEVIEASDVVLVHGNGLSRDQLHRFLVSTKKKAGSKPVVVNEDSACISRFDVAFDLGVSWGYYNNYSKQIPPCLYGIEPGEDVFFAERMMRKLGIAFPNQYVPESDDYILQGGEGHDVVGRDGTYFFRIASRFPESIYRIVYSVNGKKVDVSYDEPFFFQTENTWIAFPWKPQEGDCLEAEICSVKGEKIYRKWIYK